MIVYMMLFLFALARMQRIHHGNSTDKEELQLAANASSPVVYYQQDTPPHSHCKSERDAVAVCNQVLLTPTKQSPGREMLSSSTEKHSLGEFYGSHSPLRTPQSNATATFAKRMRAMGSSQNLYSQSAAEDLNELMNDIVLVRTISV